MTYNVHACRGRDRQWSPQRIADVIASAEPDIVALQELDVGRARSGGADQAEMIVLSARHEGAVLSRAPGDGRALSRRHPTACPSRLIDRANGGLVIEVWLADGAIA